MKLTLAYLILRCFALVLRVQVPDWAHPQVTTSYKIRAVMARAILSINGFTSCVLSDGTLGWQRGNSKGTLKFAMEQINSGMPQEL